jgi:hypothetical protein
MNISSSNFHQRQIPFEFRSPHDGTVDPLEVQSIPYKDSIMVRIHQSEIQPVPIFVTYQMAKVKVDFPVDSKNQILHGDRRFWSTVNEERLVQGLLPVHGILDTEPQLEELAGIISGDVPIEIGLFSMEFHPTWCWGAIAHGHLVKQPIGVILFKPA